jgi:hypothetical protein
LLKCCQFWARRREKFDEGSTGTGTVNKKWRELFVALHLVPKMCFHGPKQWKESMMSGNTVPVKVTANIKNSMFLFSLTFVICTTVFYLLFFRYRERKWMRRTDIYAGSENLHCFILWVKKER